MEKNGDRCPECGEKMVHRSGCFECPHCGYGRCG